MKCVFTMMDGETWETEEDPSAVQQFIDGQIDHWFFMEDDGTVHHVFRWAVASISTQRT